MYYSIGTLTQSFAGIAISDGTKYETFGPAVSAGSDLNVSTWTNRTTFNANVFAQQVLGNLGSSNYIALKLSDNGTNRVWSISTNGVVFHQIVSEASNTFLTPTQVGIFVVNNQGANTSVQEWLLSCSGC